MAKDVFQTTQNTWIDQRLADGLAGRDDVNRHIMTVYAWPLRVYYLGTSLRWLGEPEDIVQGFFASRLPREDFLAGWQANGMRLRRWLMNAFSFYLLEQRRETLKARRQQAIPDDPPEFDGDPQAAVDHAFVVSIVRQALEQAQQRCNERSLDDHWQIFIDHYYHQRSYADIAPLFDVDEARAAVMARTAAKHFRTCLRELLASDGATEPEIDEEINALLSTMTS